MKKVQRIELKLSKENLEKLKKGLKFQQEFSGKLYTDCVYVGHIVSSECDGDKMTITLKLPTGEYKKQNIDFKLKVFEPVIAFEEIDEVFLFYLKTPLSMDNELNHLRGYEIQSYLFLEEELIALIYYYSFSNECDLATILFTYIKLFANQEFSTNKANKVKIDDMLKEKFKYYGIELSMNNKFNNPYLPGLFKCFLEAFTDSKPNFFFGHVRKEYVKCLDYGVIFN